MPLRLFAALLLLPLLLAACSDRDDGSGSVPSSSTAANEAASATPEGPTATLGADNGRATMATPLPVSVEGPAGHDLDRALAHIEALSGVIGERVSGTPGEDEAVEYIAGELSRFGYDVEIMQFEFATGGFADNTLRAGSAQIASRRFNGSGTDELSGQAVFVGLADPAGLEGKDLAGKIAVADRGTLTFTDKYRAVQAEGAAGLIVINNEPGLFAGRIDPPASEPVLGVSIEDRDTILAAIEAGDDFTLSVPLFEAKNVIARPGENAECRVLVGSHHDTVPAVPGATDNASGTANVLELARAFAVDGLEDNLCFVTFGGEESGLHGSTTLAIELRDQQELPSIYVNLDVTGTGDTIEAIGDAALTEEAVQAAESLGLAARATSEPPGTSSDHASFRRVGVPVIFFASDDFSTIHTPGDTVDTINPELHDQIGDLAYELITEYLERFAGG